MVTAPPEGATVRLTGTVTGELGAPGADSVTVPFRDVCAPITSPGLMIVTLNWPLPLPEPEPTCNHGVDVVAVHATGEVPNETPTFCGVKPLMVAPFLLIVNARLEGDADTLGDGPPPPKMGPGVPAAGQLAR